MTAILFVYINYVFLIMFLLQVTPFWDMLASDFICFFGLDLKTIWI